ncbi:hypothetical protein L208DRAFT_1324570, partial [Tricholoma matsutake]
AKCAPVCPYENSNCCMARLLSKQDDFANQVSMLKIVIKEASHECIFLPKFHCEFHPIKMVSFQFLSMDTRISWICHTGWAKYRYRQAPKRHLMMQRKLQSAPSTPVRLKSFGGL